MNYATSIRMFKMNASANRNIDRPPSPHASVAGRVSLIGLTIQPLIASFWLMSVLDASRSDGCSLPFTDTGFLNLSIFDYALLSFTDLKRQFVLCSSSFQLSCVLSNLRFGTMALDADPALVVNSGKLGLRQLWHIQYATS
jgi:hypothetical protein